MRGMPVVDPLVVEWAWQGRAQRIELWASRPGGEAYRDAPRDATEALERRQERISVTSRAGGVEARAAGGRRIRSRSICAGLRCPREVVRARARRLRVSTARGGAADDDDDARRRHGRRLHGRPAQRRRGRSAGHARAGCVHRRRAARAQLSGDHDRRHGDVGDLAARHDDRRALRRAAGDELGSDRPYSLGLTMGGDYFTVTYEGEIYLAAGSTTLSSRPTTRASSNRSRQRPAHRARALQRQHARAARA